MISKTALTTGAVALLVLAGCSTGSEDPTAAPELTTPFAEVDRSFLNPYGLADSEPRDIVTALDQTNDDREAGLAGSVRYDYVVFTTEDGEQRIPLAEDEFYLSVAPYVDQTHECYYHNLSSCQGELVGEDVDVTITSTDGEVLVDDTVTTYDNGFVGFWLPRDIQGTIEVQFDGRSVTAPVATGPEDPTCVTTLQLT